jgi:hypothetical protein
MREVVQVLVDGKSNKEVAQASERFQILHQLALLFGA